MPIIIPGTGQLTTIGAVREFLQKSSADIAQDELIESLIERASVVLQNRFGREWVPTSNQTRTLTYRGSGYIDIAPWDLRTVTAITYDSDGTSPITLTVGGWRLRAPAHGVFRSIYMPNYVRDEWSDMTVSVTGDWGFATVPADVEHACIVTVAAWLRRDVTAFSSTFSVDEGRLDRPEAIPSSVVRALDHYYIPVVA